MKNKTNNKQITNAPQRGLQPPQPLSWIRLCYIIADYQDSPTNLSFCKLIILRFAMSKKLSISLKLQVLK